MATDKREEYGEEYKIRGRETLRAIRDLAGALAGADPRCAMEAGDFDTLSRSLDELTCFATDSALAITNKGHAQDVIDLARVVMPIYKRVFEDDPSSPANGEQVDRATLIESGSDEAELIGLYRALLPINGPGVLLALKRILAEQPHHEDERDAPEVRAEASNVPSDDEGPSLGVPGVLAEVGMSVRILHGGGETYTGAIVEVAQRGCWVMMDNLADDDGADDGSIAIAWRNVALIPRNAAVVA